MGARGALNATPIFRLDKSPTRYSQGPKATRATIEPTSSDYSRALI